LAGRRRSVATRERDIEALKLRREGKSYEQIAAAMSWRSSSSAYEAVQRALADSAREAVEELRQLEDARLDDLMQRLQEVLGRKHYCVSSSGIVVLHPETEEPLLDDGPVIQAVLALLRVSERRAKLHGLDAPTKHEVITLGWIEAAIAQMEAQIGRLPGGSETGPLALPPAPPPGT
jgi:hypothetical protein